MFGTAAVRGVCDRMKPGVVGPAGVVTAPCHAATTVSHRRRRNAGWSPGWLAAFAILALPLAAPAQSLIAARTVKAKTIVQAEDLVRSDTMFAGALSDPADVVGLEARVALFAGRPILPGDVGPPAIVERNQTVELRFRRGGIAISTEGRALDRGAAGDTIRVMNVASRTTVSAVIGADGTLRVSGGDATQP